MLLVVGTGDGPTGVGTISPLTLPLLTHLFQSRIHDHRTLSDNWGMPPTRSLLRAMLYPCLAMGASLGLVDSAAALVRKRAMRVKAGGVLVNILAWSMREGGAVVSLGRSSLTNHPGPVILWNADKSLVCTLGTVLADSGTSVTRQVVGAVPEGLLGASSGFLYGHIGQTPADFDLVYEEINLGTSTCWVVPPAGSVSPQQTWAIHVHGLGGGRNQTLRGLPVFSHEGVTSLVPTLGISMDRGAQHDSQGSFGINEVAALEAAHDHAVACGATKVIFVGWSYGALAVVQAISTNQWADVSGLVLVSPALDWRLIVSNGLKGAGVGSAIARILMARFNSPLARQGAAWEVWPCIEDNVARVLSSWPTLIVHGEEDALVPQSQSLELSQRFQGNVVAHFFPDSHHGMEWNSSKDVWDEIVGDWVAKH